MPSPSALAAPEPPPEPTPGPAPVAVFTNVAKSYRAGRVTFPALRGISGQVPRGGTCYILGPSGSGKTTLLNLLGVVDRPDSGAVTILGTAVSALSEGAAADFRRRHIGTIFQSFNLIPVLSALENVEYTLLGRGLARAERRERAAACLERVGLADFLNRRPGELSGGQRQRVAIARALVGEPDLVVADEPTANLDSRTTGEIVELMARMRAELNTTFVLCTHDPALVTGPGRLLRVVDGRVAQEETLP
jgi:putative ABC transport system ATP-binding protein